MNTTADTADWDGEPTRTDFVARLPLAVMTDLIAHGEDAAAQAELAALQTNNDNGQEG